MGSSGRRPETCTISAVSMCSNVRVRKFDLIDHLVCVGEQRRWDAKAERGCSVTPAN
jgi:hypothetical protein